MALIAEALHTAASAVPVTLNGKPWAASQVRKEVESFPLYHPEREKRATATHGEFI